MAIKDLSVRIGQEELGRIFTLKEHLDQKELLLHYAPRYRQLGWVLVLMRAPAGTPLDLDWSQPAELWPQQLSQLGADQAPINLGLRTGKGSNLLVLEVNKGEGALTLDQGGEWRAACVAEVGGCREQHYYALPPEAQAPPSFFLAPQVLIYGEGGLVLTPPSLEPQAQEAWRWLAPPLETPPQPPQPAVWQFINEYIPSAPVQPELPSWPEVYRLIAPHGAILNALLRPPSSPEEYYQGILHTARGLGLQEPAILLGLLWHAPHGEGRSNPDKLKDFQEMVNAISPPGYGGPGAGGVPARLEDAAGRPGNLEPAAATGPAPEVLNLLAASGPTDQTPQNRGESGTPRFDQSVSGQFFHLLAGLGEKVIMESCRYEAMLAGLNQQAGAIDSLVSQWEQHFTGSAGAPGEAGARPGGSTVEFSWNDLLGNSAYKKQQLQEIQVAAADFLKQNPDLAMDRHQVQMVVFCLKNYISINPEFAALPFREKLERAGAMARGFSRRRGELS